MRKYKIEDFDVMHFNPLRHMDKGVRADDGLRGMMFRKWTHLGDLPSWRLRRSEVFNGVRDDVVCCYIMLLYQVGTPLMGIGNLIERKVVAADLAGFIREGERFVDGYGEVMSGEIAEVNERIVDFCRVQRSTDWAEYVVYEEVFYRQLGMAMGKTDPKEVSGMMGNVKVAKEKMESLRKVLLGGDDTRSLISRFLEQSMVESIRLRREHIAEALNEGVDPLGGYNPYGDYKKEYSKDINQGDDDDEG
jgi:hypothetical protein